MVIGITHGKNVKGEKSKAEGGAGATASLDQDISR